MKSCSSLSDHITFPIVNFAGSGAITKSIPSNLKLSFTTINPDVRNIGFIKLLVSESIFVDADVELTAESI